MTITRQCTLTAERQTTADLSVFAATAPSISSTIARTGTYSYRAANTTYAFGRAITSMSAVRIGYWLHHNGVTAGGFPQLFMVGSGTSLDESYLLRVEWDEATGVLRVRRATASNTYETLDSASVPAALLATASHVHVGMTLYSHASSGFLTVYVNGVAVLNHTGDTRLSAWNGLGGGSSAQIFDTSFSRFWVAGRAQSGDSSFASFAYADDIFVDSYASEPDLPVPSRRFLERICNAAGGNAEWTPLASTNVSQIDDGQPNGGANDGDTTYNKAEAANLRDTFEFNSITLPDGYRVIAVMPYAHCKSLDSGPEISLHLWDGATYGDGADQVPPLDYTIELFERFTEMPDTSEFDEAGVNGLQAGYRSRGTFA